MTISWNAETDAKLVTALVATTKSVDYDAVAKFMGPGCTVSAVKHRVARLKKIADLACTKSGADAGASRSIPTSPAKVKRATPMKATYKGGQDNLQPAKPKKLASAIQEANSASDDNEDEEEDEDSSFA